MQLLCTNAIVACTMAKPPKSPHANTLGPFRAEHLREDGNYELSMGHPLLMSPAGGRHGSKSYAGALVVGSDPKVTEIGMDVGHELSEHTVRAPDVSVGNVSSEPGWSKGAPMLAMEYADRGTDEQDLKTKITELLNAGTKYVWVIRLVGVQRVEVHEPAAKMRTFTASDTLTAEGVLANPVPVRALFDPELAREIALRNMLTTAGVDNFDEIQRIQELAFEAGKAEGKAEGIVESIATVAQHKLGTEWTESSRTDLEAVIATKGHAAVWKLVLELDAPALNTLLAHHRTK